MGASEFEKVIDGVFPRNRFRPEHYPDGPVVLDDSKNEIFCRAKSMDRADYYALVMNLMPCDPR